MREMSTYDGDVFAYADDIIDGIELKEITKIADLREEIERKDAEITRLRLRILVHELTADLDSRRSRPWWRRLVG